MATKGSKTKFAYGDAVEPSDDTPMYQRTSNWTDFAKVTDIKPPKISADDIETSHMESPEQFKQFEPGWAEAGEVEVTIQFEKARNAEVYGLFRQPRAFKMTFSEGSQWLMDGYIKEFGNEVEREKIVTTTVTVKLSGKPEFVPAT